MNYVFLRWQDFDIMIKELAKKVKVSGEKFSAIYGIPRNGLMIAVPLSHKLKLPLVMYPTLDTLVVDDRSHTGKTLASMRNKKIATLYNTKGTAVEPNWFVEYMNRDDWVVFPWEEDYIK